VRISVEDADTRMPGKNIEVVLEGEYEDRDRSGTRTTREFRLVATTDEQGIAVFGLLWHKVSRHEAGVDDIEKVNRLVVRSDGYRHVMRRLDLAFLQNDPDQSWKELISKTPGAKYFIAFPGPRFTDYNNKRSRSELFFDKIRRGDYDRTFPASENSERSFPRHFVVSNPQVQAGPFMMLPIAVRMKRLSTEHRVGRRADEDPARRAGRPRTGSRAESTPNTTHHREANTHCAGSSVTKDEMPPGHLPIADVKRIHSLINKSMTQEQIIKRLGKPSRSWTAPAGNRCHFWQAWENSRWGVLVVVSPRGEIIRIEMDN